MNKRIKIIVLTVLSAVGMLAATSSASACWFWSLYQPECPKSLLK
ncbi:cyclic lactone autoinducer peptide [Ruminiclostridium sufflavum]|nr:cyclic lactone autoinducer peptide [Ruminiclostridium sufflavum]